MKNTLLKSFRTALIFAAIGASVAVAVPIIMSGLAAMGLVNAGTLGTLVAANVVHTSLVFGLFGALDPVYRVACNSIMGKEPPEQSAPSAVIMAPSMEIARSADHAATLERERIAQESFQKFR